MAARQHHGSDAGSWFVTANSPQELTFEVISIGDEGALGLIGQTLIVGRELFMI